MIDKIAHNFDCCHLDLANSSVILNVTSLSKLSGIMYSIDAFLVKLLDIATAAINFISSVIYEKLCFNIPLNIPGKTKELLI